MTLFSRRDWLTCVCSLGLVLASSIALADDTDPRILAPNQKELFIDDYNVQEISNLKRTLHQPVKYEGNPILRPEYPWEDKVIQTRSAPFWDPEQKVWKLFYFAFATNSLEGQKDLFTSCYAVSKDGLTWKKPSLNRVEWNGSKKNNMVVPPVFGAPRERDDFLYHVLYDAEDVAARRYKGLFGIANRRPAVSADGFHWTRLEVPPLRSFDESQLTYDERGRQFVATVKLPGPYTRAVFLSVSEDFEKWTQPELIFHADEQDQQSGKQRVAGRMQDERYLPLFGDPPRHSNTDVYNMPVFPYEGLYLGLPAMFHAAGRDGFHVIELAASRDLHQWTRVADRAVFLPNSFAGAKGYDTATVLATRPVVRDDELWFYYTGIKRRFHPDMLKTRSDGTKYHVSLPDTGGIHLAKLRLDGFVSLDADSREGSVLTQPLLLQGRRLYVNVDAAEGEVRAEIIDAQNGSSIGSFSPDNSLPVQGNQLSAELKWKDSPDLSQLRDKPVRIRFVLRNASLYSFWTRRGKENTAIP